MTAELAMVIGRMRDARAAVLRAPSGRAAMRAFARAVRAHNELVGGGALTVEQAVSELRDLAARRDLDDDTVASMLAKKLQRAGTRTDDELTQPEPETTRVRAHPLGAPKALPARCTRWPDATVIWHMPESRGVGVLLEVVAGWVIAEHLVFPDTAPSQELQRYVDERRARVVAGLPRTISLLSRVEAGRMMRKLGFRRGDAIVAAGMGRQLVALADHCGWSSDDPHAPSLVLYGLGSRRGRRFKAYRDSPRITLAPIGDSVLAGWTKALDDPFDADGNRMRPDAQRGPFVDVLALGGALTGRDASSELRSTCARFGVEVPELGSSPIDVARADAHAIAALYSAQLDVVRHLGLGLDPSQLVSTGGITSAMLREAGLSPLASRMRLPAWLAGAAASAFFGPWSAAPVVHVPCPAVSADISGTYARVGSAVGVQRFYTARWVGWQRSFKKTRKLIHTIASGRRPVDRDALSRLGPTLVRVVPHQHMLSAKPVRAGEARLVFAPYTNPDGVWRWATDVLAGAFLDGGRLPEIVDAVRLVPYGTQSGLRPVRLPTARRVDINTEDLALAIVDERAVVAHDLTLPAWQRAQLDGLLKRCGQTMFYGNVARVDRERHRSAVEDRALDPYGHLLTLATPTPERPGPWCSLAIAGMVTAAARLIVAHTIAALEAAGGTWLACNVDSLVIAATHHHEPELIACPGGPIEIDGVRYVRALPIPVIETVLDRTDPLLCPTGSRAWKREAGFDRPMLGYVSGIYKYALIDPVTGTAHAGEPALGGIYADPTGTSARTTDGHWRWAIDAHVAVARAGLVWDGHGPVPALDLPGWAERPALRVGCATTPDEVARLQRAFPGRKILPYTRYFQAVVDPLVNPGVVAVTLDVHVPPERWLDADWRDQHSGEPIALTTGPVAIDMPADAPVVRVRAIRELLHVWRIPTDTTTRPVEPTGHVLERGVRIPIPVRSRDDLTEIVGKEGDDLYRQLADPNAIKGDDLNIYRLADTWTPILERAKALGAKELNRRGVHRSTAYEVLAEHRRPSAETAALIAEIVRDTDTRAPTSLWRPCARPGCPKIVKTPQLWCRPGCKKAVQRAEEALALHARGAKRCRRCDTIRYGSHTGSCPGCASRAWVEIDAVVCRYCGTLRVGDTTSNCPDCRESQS